MRKGPMTAGWLQVLRCCHAESTHILPCSARTSTIAPLSAWVHFPGKLQLQRSSLPSGAVCPPAHLGLVPGLNLGPAAAGDAIILSLDLSHNRVHVELPAVVHLDHHRGIRDLRLKEADFLWETTTSTLSPKPSLILLSAGNSNTNPNSEI